MPFLKGRGALRRTREWLEQGEFMLRDHIKVVSFAYSPGKRFPHHDGLEKFVFWHLPQLKYKNPKIQFVTFKYMTPTPWIRVYQDDDRQVLVDCDSRTRQEIHDHFKQIFNKSEEVLEAEAKARQSVLANPANFGVNFDRHCICTSHGQVLCPGYKELPKSMQGKWKHKFSMGEIAPEELEEMDRIHAERVKNM